MQSLKAILLVFFILSVFYFSWLTDSEFTNESYLPSSIIRLANTYFNIRTAVPFIFISYLIADFNLFNSSYFFRRIHHLKFYKFLQVILFCTLIVGFAEFGQLFIKNRFTDINDIFFGITGSLIGLVINFYKDKLKQFFFKTKNEK